MSAPTREERLVALTMASCALNAARRLVVPSGDRCVLDRASNYAYQTHLQEAQEALEKADKLLMDQVHELVPSRCGWPGGHVKSADHTRDECVL